MPDIATVTPDGKLTLRLHPGQVKAWNSEKRFVAIIAGTQSGKTAYGPFWLFRELQRRGAGDYLIVTTTYPLLTHKVLPETLKLFQRQLGLGAYNEQKKTFTLTEDGQRRTHGAASDTPTKVFFSHATDPEALEAATAKAAWLDEAGQTSFRLGSFEAVERRLAVHRGRCLVTSTPYGLGWMKQRLYDPWQAARQGHPEIDVIRFDSTENPAFPREEFERAQTTMPRWRFDMFYRGVFSRPAGLIYDSFTDAHKVPRFAIPPAWPRFGGLDFGHRNTAAVLFAEECARDGRPTGRLFAYREYRPGTRTPDEHAASLQQGEPFTVPFAGGSASEGDWRDRFAAAGVPVREPPFKDVEAGIDAVHSCFSTNALLVFDDLGGLLDELATYSREVDDRGEPTAKIAAKETYHLLDACRYGLSWKRGTAPVGAFSAARDEARSETAMAPAGMFEEEYRSE